MQSCVSQCVDWVDRYWGFEQSVKVGFVHVWWTSLIGFVVREQDYSGHFGWCCRYWFVFRSFACTRYSSITQERRSFTLLRKPSRHTRTPSQVAKSIMRPSCSRSQRRALAKCSRSFLRSMGCVFVLNVLQWLMGKQVSYEFTPNAQLWPRALNTALGGKADAYYSVISAVGGLGVHWLLLTTICAAHRL